MKQEGHAWNKTLNKQMIEWGFTRLDCEPCIYFRKTDTGWTITGVHVDDFMIVSDHKNKSEHLKTQLKTVWKISELGTATFIVGIVLEWDQQKHEVHLSQTALIDRLTSQFGQSNATPVDTPMEPGLKLQ